jgi:hypothetical protein
MYEKSVLITRHLYSAKTIVYLYLDLNKVCFSVTAIQCMHMSIVSMKI